MPGEGAPRSPLACSLLGPGAEAARRRGAQIKAWVKEMAAGGPGGEGPSGGEGAKQAKAGGEEAAAKAKAARAARDAEERERKKQEASGTRTITLTERFFCRPADIFEALTVAGRVKAYTQSDCDVSPQPGTPFRMFSGNVEGVNVEMDPGRKIVQRWRFRNWAEGVHSLVTIELSEPESGTTVARAPARCQPVPAAGRAAASAPARLRDMDTSRGGGGLLRR